MKRTVSDGSAASLPRLLYKPSGGPRAERAPLVLFLHGSGERGHGGDELARVERHGLPKLLKTQNPFLEPVYVLAPQCPEETRWIDHLGQLKALLDKTIQHYPIDTDRVYLTGVSLGGQGTWTLGAAYPELFAALTPVCGRSNLEAACRLKHVLVWAFHGAQDDRVPLAESTRMVEAVNACGGQAKLTVYPDVGHESWDKAYGTPALYSWMLAARRSS